MKKKNLFFKGLLKNIFFVIFIFCSLGLLLSIAGFDYFNQEKAEEATIPQLVQRINDGEVSKIEVSQNNVLVYLNDDSQLKIKKEEGIT